jgi:hypothetical protein
MCGLDPDMVGLMILMRDVVVVAFHSWEKEIVDATA